jgi:hypothetical protein
VIFEGQPFRGDGAFFHPVVLWALRAEPPGSSPINQKVATDFARCGFSFTPSERIRRVAGEIGDQACRCFIVAFLHVMYSNLFIYISIIHFVFRL